MSNLLLSSFILSQGLLDIHLGVTFDRRRGFGLRRNILWVVLWQSFARVQHVLEVRLFVYEDLHVVRVVGF